MMLKKGAGKGLWLLRHVSKHLESYLAWMEVNVCCVTIKESKDGDKRN